MLRRVIYSRPVERALGLSVLLALAGCYQSTVVISGEVPDGAVPSTDARGLDGARLDGGGDFREVGALDGWDLIDAGGSCACATDADCPAELPPGLPPASCFRYTCACTCVLAPSLWACGDEQWCDANGVCQDLDQPDGDVPPFDGGPVVFFDGGPVVSVDTGPTPDAVLPTPDAFARPDAAESTSRALRFRPGTVLTIPNRTGLSSGPDMSFEVWIRPRAAGVVARKGEAALNSIVVEVTNIDAMVLSLAVGFRAGSAGELMAAATVPYDGRRWVHVAWTQRRAASGALSGVLYVDGRVAGTAEGATADTFRAALNPQALRIGIGYDGDVDEVRFWSVVRDPMQILSTMSTALPWGTVGMEGYWTLGESQQVANDRSLHGNDGYLGTSPSPDIADPERIDDGPF